jgi:3-methyladenine DNA glycosylase AlkD
MEAFVALERRLAEGLEARRDPVQAVRMAAYMRDQFAFLGIPSPPRREVMREALAGIAQPTAGELAAFALGLWQHPEREYQYCACELLARHAKRLDAGAVVLLETLLTAKSWWDTVDALASNVAGPLVSAHPQLVAVMDTWSASENTWLARTAILHQLGYKARTNPERLFRYCTLRARDSEFFIRKAIGWALREYSKTDADAVRGYVAAHPELSGLSKREALLWLNGGRGAKAP